MSGDTPPAPALDALTPEAKRRLLAELLAKRQQAQAQSATEPVATPNAPSQATAPQRFVLTAAQRRLWFIEQLSPGLAAYHLPAAVQLDGALDTAALNRALQALLARHEILRAQCHDDAGEPWLAIAAIDPAATLALESEPIAETEDTDATIRQALRALVAPPFDLPRGPLLRARLLRLAPQRHVLLLCVHHLVADHASMRLLMRDLAALYAGLPLPPLALQFVDYAAWQAEREATLGAQERGWWCAQLADPPPDLPLPTDRPRPPVQQGLGAQHGFTLPPALAQGLRALARQAQTSLFATLLAGWQAWLARASGQHDVWVGSLVAQRERPETAPLVGLFVNNLVLRARVDESAGFRSLLAQVRQTTLDALAHQQFPFEQLVDALRCERRLDRHPLFQTSFVLHEGADGDTARALQLPGLTLRPLPADAGTTRFDLALDISDDGQALHARLEYDRALFDAASIQRLARQYTRLLQAAVAAPDAPLARLDLMDDAERARIATWNQTARPLPAADVWQLLRQQALAQPEAEALRVPAGPGQAAQVLSYARLARRAAQIAHTLAALPPGSVVGLCLPRNADLPAALLACLARGLAYLPLDPAQPPARLAALLHEAEAATVLLHAPDAALAQALAHRPTQDLGSLPELPTEATLEDALAGLPTAPWPPDTTAYLIFTSGTTGRPKGVPISQGSLLNLLLSMAREPGMARGDTLLAVTTVAFDIAALELLLPLVCGARLVLAGRDTVADGAALARLLRDEAVTHLQATPAGWRVLLASGWTHGATAAGDVQGLKMLCGGEALEPALAAQLLQAGGPHGALWNVYGPTETTIWSAALRITPALLQNTGPGHGVPIGGPLDNTTLQVLSPEGQALPVGLAGELAIGGAGLTPGYWRQPALDAQRFLALPFDGRRTQRLYRTGDLVRRREDGLFDYLGRLDHQIKLRGFRIEPAEIEAALTAQPGVAQAVVLLQGTSDAARLVAYLVAANGTAPDTATLRRALAGQLPAYMQPAAWVWLPALPLSANGKLDRRALPLPDAADDTPHGGPPGEPPRGATETALAALWAELLQQPVAEREAHFFALGGHSLLAARLMARIAQPEGFGRTLPLRTLFEQPTLAALAAAIDAAGGAEGVPANAASQPTLPDIPRLPAGAEPPLSPAQQRLWVLAQLEPDSPFYNIAAAVHWARPLPREALRQRLRALAARHDNLRSRFHDVQGQARLEILPTLEAPLQWLQPQTGVPAREQLAAEARRPFRLDEAPLWRVVVLPDEAGEQQGQHLMVVMHHILADAASLTRWVQELLTSPGDTEPEPLPLQYADYAAWQRAQDHGPALAWWQRQLAGAPTLLDLPTDFARPEQQRLEGGSQRLALDAATRDALAAFAHTQGATLYMLLLAAWKLLLSRYSGSPDIVVGTPVGHRPRPELERVIGLFANTLALRTSLAEVPHFQALLARVRDTVLAAWDHQQVPFEQVVDALDVPRHWRHAPLFQTLLLWQPAAETAASAAGVDPGWQAQPLDLGVTRFDITLALADEAAGLQARIDYRRDLFLPGSIAALAQAYAELLRQIAHQPAQRLQPLARLPLWPAEQLDVLKAFNASALVHNRAASLHQLVATQARRTPGALALVCGTRRYSYRQLIQHSQALAAVLRAQGAGPERTVGVCLPRRAELVFSLLAVLQTGAAYVPLDPAYPAERLGWIAEDARLTALLATPEQAAAIAQLPGVPRIDPVALLADQACADAASPASQDTNASRPEHLAYLIYTSGSTGRPKGVAIEHRQAVAMVHWALHAFTPAQRAAVLFSTSVCFDLSVFELFVPLAGGGCVVVAEDALQLPQLPAAAEVTLLNTVPTACAELQRLGPLPPGVHTVNLAGEPIPPALVQALYAQPQVQAVYNLYGPSEDTTYSTGLRLPREGGGAVVPIGLPIANTEAWVLDEALQPVPPGLPGELYLAGEGVARGYWQRPALTAERFIPNPFASSSNPPSQATGHSTLYRTGDRVRQRPDGVLEFLGRIDQQVKIRGFRIELGEVEAALEAVPGVRQALAGAQRDANGHQRLLAWVVPQNRPEPGLADDQASALLAHARQQLRERLPAFMQPSALGLLDALPLLPNGKLNRQAVPALAQGLIDQEAETGRAGEPPQGATETLLARLWAQVLGRGQGAGAPLLPSRHEGFFERGGDSILAIQLVARAREAGLPLAPRDVFLHPSLAALAARAEALRAELGANVVNQDHAAWQGPLGLTPAQHWFFTLPLQQPGHWNQALLLKLNQPLPAPRLAAALRALRDTHDALRARFVQDARGHWVQHIDAAGTAGDAPLPQPLLHRRLQAADAEAAHTLIAQQAAAMQAGMDLATGPLWRVLLLEVQHPGGHEHRLLVVAHHLLIDGVSWRILLHDLQRLLAMPAASELPAALPRSSPIAHWLQALDARGPAFQDERGYWQQQCQAPAAALPLCWPGGPNTMREVSTLSRALTPETSTQLLQALPAASRLRVDELLLTALLVALRDWAGPGARRLVLEGHGRGDLADQPAHLDLSRSVGWFTALYPLHLDIADAGPAEALKHVRRTLAAVPQHGLGWGWLRQQQQQQQAAALVGSHGHTDEPLPPLPNELRFNYLGQGDGLFGGAEGAAALFAPADEPSGPARHPDDPREVLLDFNALASRGRLRLHAGFSRGLHTPARIEALLDAWVAAVQALLAHALSDQADGSAVAADFPLMDLDADALDDLLDSL